MTSPSDSGYGFNLDPTTLALLGFASGMLTPTRGGAMGPAFGAGLQGAMTGLMAGQSSVDRRRRIEEDEKDRAERMALAREKFDMTKAAAASKAADGQSVIDMLSGGGGGYTPGFNVQPGGGGAPRLGPDLDQAATVIGGMEANKYDAIHPVANDKGNRAYGKYGVMDFNIGPWTQEVTGRAWTPQEFIANTPEANAVQDAVFKKKFGEYTQKYGNRAASAWFAGENGMNNPGAKDVLGTSVAGYQQNFDTGMGRGGPQVAQVGGGPIPQGDAGQQQADILKAMPPELREIIKQTAVREPGKAREMLARYITEQQKSEAWVPLSPENAKMFLGPAYDGTKAYQQNRITKKIELIGGGVSVNTNIDQRGQSEFGKQMGKMDAERFGEIIKSEGTLNDMASKVGFALDQLKQTYTGPAGETANAFFKILGAAGVDAAKDKANAADAGMAVISQMKPYMRASGSGASSDRDMDMFARALPSLLNMPGGNERIAAYFQRLADRATQIRQLAQEHSEGGKVPLTGTKFDDEVKKLGPLFTEDERKEMMGLTSKKTENRPPISSFGRDPSTGAPMPGQTRPPLSSFGR